MRRQLAVRIFDGEVFLVIAHHRDQHFFGKREKFAIEVTQNDRRKFGEVDNGIQQFFVFAPARTRHGSGGGVERLANPLLALLRTSHHRRFQQTSV